MDLLGLGEIITIVAVVLLSLPLIAGGVLVVLIVANRADPDPSGRRPAVVYSYASSFATLFVTLFATFVVVGELTSLIGTRHSASLSQSVDSDFLDTNPAPVFGGPKHPIGDSVARGVVIGLLIAIVAGFVYWRHVRAADRATAGLAFADPSGRVRSSYVSAVSFVCVVIAVISVVVASYQVFRLIAPGVFNASGSGSRADALRTFLPFVYLAAAALWLLRRHVTQLPPAARPWWGGPIDPPAPVTPSTLPGAVTVVEAATVAVETLEAGPPPRKRAPQKTATPKPRPTE